MTTLTDAQVGGAVTPPASATPATSATPQTPKTSAQRAADMRASGVSAACVRKTTAELTACINAGIAVYENALASFVVLQTSAPSAEQTHAFRAAAIALGYAPDNLCVLVAPADVLPGTMRQAIASVSPMELVVADAAAAELVRAAFELSSPLSYNCALEVFGIRVVAFEHFGEDMHDAAAKKRNWLALKGLSCR